jgi:hypothetical protein
MKRMKKAVLTLLVLLTLLPFAQAMAQTQTPAPKPAPVVDAATAQFLATLAGGQTQAPNDLTPAPLFKTGCSTNADCPSGQLCCVLCGNPPDDGTSCKGCYQGTRCPRIV